MKNISVAIISPNKNAYSETFIQLHVSRINAKVYYLFNGFVPHHSQDNELNISGSLFKRMIEKFYKTFFPHTLTPQQKKVALYLHRHKIQLVLAEFGMTGAAMINVCKKNNIPLLVFFHGLDAYKKEVLHFYKSAYKKLFHFAACIFVVSQHMYQQLISIGCPAEKLILNYYGPAEIFFTTKPNYQSKNFLAVGRFVEKKAPHRTIQAFAKVLQKHTNAQLIMVGEGALLEDAKKLAADLQIAANINFTGALPQKNILELYNNCVAFVQHSVTAMDGDCEGTPIAVLEAGAAALPVIATAHTGIEEVIIHNETGFLVTEQDVESMAKYMIYLLENSATARAMGAKARVRIQTHFNITQHIATINNTIEKIVQ